MRTGVIAQHICRAADITVAAVVTVSIVDIFQIVQIHHHKRRDFQLFRVFKALLRKTLESPAVQQVRQNVVIAFIFDTVPFYHFRRHILHHAQDRLRPRRGF